MLVVSGCWTAQTSPIVRQKYHGVALIPTSVALPTLPFNRPFHPTGIQFQLVAIENVPWLTLRVDAIENRQSDGATKKTFTKREPTPEIRMSYEDMCTKVLTPCRVGGQPCLDRVLNMRVVNRDVDSHIVLDALPMEKQVWVWVVAALRVSRRSCQRAR